MPQSTPDRARPQVTIAAWLVMSGSVFVVLTAFDQMAGLRSMETREAVEEFLSRPPGDGLGLGVQGMLSLMRVLTMVAAACATAAAILGFQVLRRSAVRAAGAHRAGGAVVRRPASRSAACPAAIIVGSIIMLWFQPARDWIDGKAPRAVAAPPAVAATGAPLRRPQPRHRRPRRRRRVPTPASVRRPSHRPRRGPPALRPTPPHRPGPRARTP